MPPVIDLHCDTLYKLATAPDLFFVPQEKASSHIFFSGLRSSGTLLQCFALFTDLCEHHDFSPLSCVQKQTACFQNILSHSGEHMMQILTASQLKACIKQNKIGALLTLEESCLSEFPVSLLPYFYSIGVRIATLTWDYSNLLATSALRIVPDFCSGLPSHSSSLLSSLSPDSGLTKCGFDFVAEAERLGIIIDVSHLSDEGFRDIATHCKKPFLASHSNARSACNTPRNLSDSMLRTLAEHGGLTGLCLHEPFLTDSPCSDTDIRTAIITHAKHIRNIAGTDILALGTDFDGTPGNRAITDISKLFLLEDLLKKAGFSSGEIEKIFYKNALRFLTENLPE